jgi:hypothetical protein
MKRHHVLARSFEKERVSRNLDSLRFIAILLVGVFILRLGVSFMTPVLRRYESNILELVSVLVTSSSVLTEFAPLPENVTLTTQNRIRAARFSGVFCVVCSLSAVVFDGAFRISGVEDSTSGQIMTDKLFMDQTKPVGHSLAFEIEVNFPVHLPCTNSTCIR